MLLDKVFGADRTDAADVAELDHITALPGTGTADLTAAQRTEMDKNLELIVEALGDADKFAAAVAARGVFDGSISGTAAARAKAAATTFTNVDSTATAYLAMTANTRFGISKKQTRTVAKDDFGAAAVKPFAYSPMKKANFAALPQAGAAEYNGRTMAISMDGKTIYNGDISLQVRFRGKRVSGLVENLRDGTGNRYTYGFGTVQAIRLAEATIGTTGSFMKMGERDSQILFLAEPGQPQAITLSNTGDGESAVIGSAFAGQFVGKGAAAIGTWGVNIGTNAEKLTASFGVEKGADVPETVPTPEGGGVSMTRIRNTNIDGTAVSSLNAKAVITLVTKDTNATPPRPKTITVNGADLFDSDGTVIKGANFVADAIKEINKQLDRLNAFIALDNLGGNEDPADNGRAAVWTALQAAINALFGEGFGAQIFTSDHASQTDADNDNARDTLAKERIAAVLDALSTKAKFRAAVKEGGTLYGTGSGIITGNNAAAINKAADAAFDRVDTTLTVEYGSTKYTRFGVWNRTHSANARAEPMAPNGSLPDGLFAYSPLPATTYSTTDPTFPGGGEATYEGTTIARSTNTADSAGVKPNTYFEGDIKLVVTWATNVSTAGNVGTLTASVSDLRDSKGNLYTNAPGGGENNTVSTIVLAGDAVEIARSEADATLNQLSFSETQSSTRLRHSDLRVADEIVSATISGTFVGKVIDGPLGIIGTWGLTNTNGADLEGAYGADLMP